MSMSGGGFASGIIDLGGLEVCQVSTFTKVWATQEGGPDNHGATFFEPSSLPDGFFMLGCYGQSNNKPLYGWVLAGKDATNDPSGGALKPPTDYTLVWSSDSLKIKQEGVGYIWLPIPPDGYKAVGHVITNSPEKPDLDKIRCVRLDFTDSNENDAWIWGPAKEVSTNGISIYSSRPRNRGVQAVGVPTGTFVAENNGASLDLPCLKNANGNQNSMPNQDQIKALVQAYSPHIYFHPDEQYFPSSVAWFFENGALLHTQGDESNPIPIDPMGSNLPQGGPNDDAYWIDLPIDSAAKERVKKGDLADAYAYLHVKPMFGKIGEHVGDWEHVTLRISNFNGELKSMYFSQHSKGVWADASDLEFENGNKPVAYSSLHGHASYPNQGLVLQGNGSIGIRNDSAKGKSFMDTGAKFLVVDAEYLGLVKVGKVLPGKLKSAFEKVVNSLPKEVLGEEGPTGPKMKDSWTGDERSNSIKVGIF
ncbi:hypothetical protein Sango_0172200 [Sesamum angolense]|uniref:Vacuolar protein sorting-associated protein 62 n=1 Tax=Sesamum angolense TaxID=2727404 RepID=A0AAE1XFK9_9LAMI|nr:hypothetical protein Sango_0172200 [Sesamum angolense]